MKRFGLRRTRSAATAITSKPSNEDAKIIAAEKADIPPKPKPLRPSRDVIPGLNAKQGFFLRHYLECNNATEAAKKAGYAKGSAGIAGFRLLTNGKIAAEIAKRRAAVVELLDFNADKAMKAAAGWGTSNMQDYFKVGEGGQPTLDWSNLTREQAGCLQELTVEEFVDGRSDKRKVRRVKFKLVDKLASLETWGKFAGAFVEKHQIDHKLTVVGTLLDEIDSAGRGARVIEAVPNPKQD